MKPQQTKPHRYILALACWIAISSGLSAQTTGASSSAPKSDAAAAEEIIMLSPFTVNASKDVGYQARETLSGGRTRTELKDISAQVDIMTEEFMSDLAITSIEDSLKYSLSIENQSDYFNATSGDNSLSNNIYDTQSGNRARGLTRASVSIGFFETSSQVDAYSTERLTFVGGPNAILFGNGLAGGSVDTGYKRAQTNKDRYSISLQVDTEDGYRSTVDMNKVLVKNVLAVRFAGVKQDVAAGRAPSYDRSERAFATVTWQPSSKLNIRAYREGGIINRSPVRSTLVQDKVTPYFDKFLTPEQKAKFLATYDPSVLVGFDNSTINSLNTNANSTAFTNAVVAQGLQPAVANVSSDIFGRNSARNPVLVLSGAQQSSIPIQSWNNTINFLTSPGQLVGDNQDWSFRDGSIYPTTMNLVGNGLQQRFRTITYGAVIEFNPFKNLFLEYARNLERVSYKSRDMLGFGNTELAIDVNKYLPSQWAVGATAPTRVLNPNYGRYYVQSTVAGGDNQQEKSDNRATASYILDFTKDKGWTKWLGSHKMLALWTTQSNQRFEQYSNGMTTANVMSDNDFTVTTNTGTGATTQSLSPLLFAANSPPQERQLIVRNYLGSPTAGVGGSPYVDIKGVDVWNWGTLGKDASGQPVVVASDDLTPTGARAYAIGNGRKETTGKLWSINSSFLNNRVILNYGYRKDKNYYNNWLDRNSTATMTVPGQPRYDAATGGFYFPTPGNPLNANYTNAPYMSWEQFKALGLDQIKSPTAFQRENPESILKGIVLHPLRWFSVFYNESNSAYAAEFTRTQTNGLPAALDDGDGKDYGFTVSTPDSKFSVRVNWFTSNRQGAVSNFFRGGSGPANRSIRDTIYVAEKTWQLNNPSYAPTTELENDARRKIYENSVPTNLTATTNLLLATNIPLPAYRDIYDALSDKSAKGVEVSMTANPIPGLSIRLGASKNKTIETNIAKTWFEFADARWTDWEKVGNATVLGVVGNTATINQYMQSIILPTMTFIKQTEGQANPQQREFRTNLTARYSIQGGRAKGFFFGGNYSWQSKSTIGFLTRPVLATEVYRTFNGIGASDGAFDVLDLKAPITSPPLTTFDGFAGYKRKIFNGRYEWLVQLNVRNLLNNDDLIAQRAYARKVNGVQETYITNYNVPTPRRFTLTNTITF